MEMYKRDTLVRVTHQRMPFLRQLNHLRVKATMVVTVITSNILLAMTLMTSKTLFLKKKLFGCIARRGVTCRLIACEG